MTAISNIKSCDFEDKWGCPRDYKELNQSISRCLGLGPSVEERTADIVKQVLTKKEALLEKALSNKWDVYNPILIGGDLFTMGYLGFEVAKSLIPATAGLASFFSFATLFFGEIGGLINLGVALISFKEAAQAFYNGDWKLGTRLALDFICLLAIGSIMILASTALKASALSAIGGLFATNPWLLPLLFFIVTIPLLIEISSREKNILLNQDIASKININKLLQDIEKGLFELPELFKVDEQNKIRLEERLDELKKCLEKLQDRELKERLLKKIENASKELLAEKIQINELEEWLFENTGTDSSIKAQIKEMKDLGLKLRITKRMEFFQAETGVKVALAAFKVWHAMLENDKEKAKASLNLLKEKVSEWNRKQHVRFTQQILYILGFGLSMGALAPKAADLMNNLDTTAMVGANGVALYMDSCWATERNTPIVTPKVEIEDIN